MEIAKRHHGASFPQIFMDGELKPVTEILGGSLLANSGVVDQLYVERPSTGLVHVTDANGDWHSVNGTNERKNGIYVPSLAELGYPIGYQLKASARVTCYSNVGAASTADIRLVQYNENFTPVAGATASKAISTSGNNEFIETPYVLITGGQNFMLDFKTQVGETFAVRVMSIHLKIEKT